MRLVDYPQLWADDSAYVSPEAHYYGKGVVKIGKNSRIDHGVILTGDVDIGKHVHIAVYTTISGTYAVRIGNYTGISAYCNILTASDDFSGLSMFGPTVPEAYKPGLKSGMVVIGRNVIIGTHCTVGPAITICDGVSVGTHSYVRDDCEPNSLYAGVPATKRKDKSMNMWALNEAFDLEGEV